MGNYLDEADQSNQFEAIVLPHLDAAYNLARWLTRNDHDAEDLVQMAFVRAVRFYSGFNGGNSGGNSGSNNGGNARAWLLTIVRNTFYTMLRAKQHEAADIDFDESAHSSHDQTEPTSPYGVGANPEHILESHDTSRVVNRALKKLPHNYREIVILKELENLSYKEIAEVAGIPIGTVMSRLARGRKLLLDYLKLAGVGESHGMQ